MVTVVVELEVAVGVAVAVVVVVVVKVVVKVVVPAITWTASIAIAKGAHLLTLEERQIVWKNKKLLEFHLATAHTRRREGTCILPATTTAAVQPSMETT